MLMETIVSSSWPHLENPSCLTVHFDLKKSSNVLAVAWAGLSSDYFFLFPVEFTYCKCRTKWDCSEQPAQGAGHFQKRERRCLLSKAWVEFLCRNNAVAGAKPSSTFSPLSGRAPSSLSQRHFTVPSAGLLFTMQQQLSTNTQMMLSHYGLISSVRPTEILQW